MQVKRVFYVHGWTVFRKEPGRRCGHVHGWTGRYMLLRNLHFHHPWWSYSARSQEGGAVMSMDGRYSARSQEGGAVMSMDGQIVEIYRLLMQILSIKITIAYDLNSAYYYQYR